MNDTVILPLTVFIVDDEPLARSRLKDLLVDCGAQIELQVVGEAGNGQEALDKLNETPAEVVLMDIRMPQMDGLTLADTLRASHPDLNVIFVSGYPVKHEAMGPRSRLLSKPFARTDLMNLVGEVAGPPQH